MKKLHTEEVAICDVCEENRVSTTCMKCGKEFCYDCEKTQIVHYRRELYGSEYNGGTYCIECNTALTIENKDQLHQAFRKLAIIKDCMDRDFKSANERAEIVAEDIKMWLAKYDAERNAK